MTDSLTPLGMARLAARQAILTNEEHDPLRAILSPPGEEWQADLSVAQLAAAMALVSIAEDIHRAAGHLGKIADAFQKIEAHR